MLHSSAGSAEISSNDTEVREDTKTLLHTSVCRAPMLFERVRGERGC